jgi:hypothetical protein
MGSNKNVVISFSIAILLLLSLLLLLTYNSKCSSNNKMQMNNMDKSQNIPTGYSNDNGKYYKCLSIGTKINYIKSFLLWNTFLFKSILKLYSLYIIICMISMCKYFLKQTMKNFIVLYIYAMMLCKFFIL